MARANRSLLIAPGETYHVIARGSGKMRIFLDDADYAAYRNLLAAYAKIYGVDIFHYVLMPNHIHVLLRPSAANLSGFMHAVQLGFAKRYCKKYRRVGHIWQGRYKSLAVANDAYLFACGNYIEMNPVRAGLVANPKDWKHSSYRKYAFGKQDALVTTDPFYPSLGATETERQRTYRETVAKTRTSVLSHSARL